MQKHYSQFIHEKDAIRRRAIAKYQTELKVRLQKMIEYDLLVKQLEEVTAMCVYIIDILLIYFCLYILFKIFKS